MTPTIKTTQSRRQAASAPRSLGVRTPRQPDPSFLLNAANDQPRDTLLERYRRTLGLDGDDLPFYGAAGAERQEWHHPAPTRRAGPPGQRIASRAQPTRGQAQRPPGRTGLSKVHVLSTLAAIIAGTAIGYGISERDAITAQITAAATHGPGNVAPERLAVARAEPEPIAPTPQKTVTTATLKVSDVSGKTNSPIPLPLKAEPAADKHDLLVRISGLPDNAYLTAGHRDRDKIWALTLDDLKDVKVVVPSIGTPKINVAVAAVEPDTGDLAAPIKTMTISLADAVIVPVSAPPPGDTRSSRTAPSTAVLSPVPAPVSTGVVLTNTQPAADLVSKGEALLASGDAAAARQHFANAWTSGSADGALGLARSYDPLVFAQLSITGSAPDRDKALAWYEQAAAAGHKKAMAAIVRLKVKP